MNTLSCRYYSYFKLIVNDMTKDFLNHPYSSSALLPPSSASNSLPEQPLPSTTSPPPPSATFPI